MMQIDLFVIYGFACYRLAQLVALDDGPLTIFLRIRRFFGKRAASGNIIYKNLTQFLSCPFCVGIWFSVFLFGAYRLNNSLLNAFVVIFSIAGLQAFLQGFMQIDE
ncbi:hypothetical protein LCGC14_0645220 [marine sediment metagenome]|uniref:DUF1360 domain-containing protein n=1 Tax=marine sediment metagenome TaxID=412755 RepID=A0A0F9TJK9_9ZZZZ